MRTKIYLQYSKNQVTKNKTHTVSPSSLQSTAILTSRSAQPIVPTVTNVCANGCDLFAQGGTQPLISFILNLDQWLIIHSHPLEKKILKFPPSTLWTLTPCHPPLKPTPYHTGSTTLLSFSSWVLNCSSGLEHQTQSLVFLTGRVWVRVLVLTLLSLS